jgi:hypothetical protein
MEINLVEAPEVRKRLGKGNKRGNAAPDPGFLRSLALEFGRRDIGGTIRISQHNSIVTVNISVMAHVCSTEFGSTVII